MSNSNRHGEWPIEGKVMNIGEISNLKSTVVKFNSLQRSTLEIWEVRLQDMNLRVHLKSLELSRMSGLQRDLQVKSFVGSYRKWIKGGQEFIASLGFAFVLMEDPRDAEDAVKELDGTRLCGKRVKVNISSLLLLRQLYSTQRQILLVQETFLLRFNEMGKLFMICFHHTFKIISSYPATFSSTPQRQTNVVIASQQSPSTHPFIFSLPSSELTLHKYSSPHRLPDQDWIY